MHVCWLIIPPATNLVCVCVILESTCLSVSVCLPHGNWNSLTLIARFTGPTWGPSGAGRTQVGPMLAHEPCYLWSLPVQTCIMLWVCYASAFRPRRHYVCGLSILPSICSSVLSPKHPLSTCTWVRWSIQPTVSIFRPVRPSVRLSVLRGFRPFPRECMEGMAWNFQCWCILTIFRSEWIIVMVCWFSSFWSQFNLVKLVKCGVSGNFLENAWREWPEILHAGVSWQLTEQIRLLWHILQNLLYSTYSSEWILVIFGTNDH